MPPRSVCLNVFTSSLGEQNSAVNNNNDTSVVQRLAQRRDSVQSDMFRRSSASSINSTPTPSSTSPSPSPSPFPLVNRAELFHPLRPMASTESMNFALHAKPCTTCAANPAKRRCSRCKAAYYCDKSCQRTDWKTHRAVCEPAVPGAAYSAPSTPNFSGPTSPANDA